MIPGRGSNLHTSVPERLEDLPELLPVVVAEDADALPEAAPVGQLCRLGPCAQSLGEELLQPGRVLGERVRLEVGLRGLVEAAVRGVGALVHVVPLALRKTPVWFVRLLSRGCPVARVRAEALGRLLRGVAVRLRLLGAKTLPA